MIRIRFVDAIARLCLAESRMWAVVLVFPLVVFLLILVEPWIALLFLIGLMFLNVPFHENDLPMFSAKTGIEFRDFKSVLSYLNSKSKIADVPIELRERFPFVVLSSYLFKRGHILLIMFIVYALIYRQLFMLPANTS